MNKPVVEHVIRRASLPWRAPQDHLTECGRPVTEHASITHDDFAYKIRTQGKQRASMSTCMVCWSTAANYRSWAEDPIDAVRREIDSPRANTDAFRRELWAIAALIQTHRSEFDDFITGLRHTTDLAAHRRAKRLTGH